MILPIVALPTDTVDIAGTKVEIKSLTRQQAIQLATKFQGDTDGADRFIIMCGVGASEEEAEAWRTSTDPKTVGTLVDAILILTGLSDDPNK